MALDLARLTRSFPKLLRLGRPVRPVEAPRSDDMPEEGRPDRFVSPTSPPAAGASRKPRNSEPPVANPSHKKAGDREQRMRDHGQAPTEPRPDPKRKAQARAAQAAPPQEPGPTPSTLAETAKARPPIIRDESPFPPEEVDAVLSHLPWRKRPGYADIVRGIHSQSAEELLPLGQQGKFRAMLRTVLQPNGYRAYFGVNGAKAERNGQTESKVLRIDRGRHRLHIDPDTHEIWISADHYGQQFK